eukprot:Ihof_evm12s109 gene=Ihof_evmTU12s109
MNCSATSFPNPLRLTWGGEVPVGLYSVCWKGVGLSTTVTKETSRSITRGLRGSLKWMALPVSVGLVAMGYKAYRQGSSEYPDKKVPEKKVVMDPWAVALLRKMPTRVLSRMWGHVADKTVPMWLRNPLFRTYCWTFGCSLDDIDSPSLTSFPTINAFFTRTLKPGRRHIESSMLVSPVDATVLYCGPAKGDTVEQVKGVRYSLKGLLGPAFNPMPKPGNTMYHIIMYLSPGDYHHYHSPADWMVLHRRHVPGDLLSVNPGVARIVQGLFNYNERVALLGQWKHGQFAYVAVGATNVGSMTLTFDKDVATNLPNCRSDAKVLERHYDE